MVATDAKSATSTAEKTAKPQQQQPVQTSAAMPAIKAVQPIQPTAAVPAMPKSVPANAPVKTPLSQATFHRHLSNAAGQKSVGVVK